MLTYSFNNACLRRIVRFIIAEKRMFGVPYHPHQSHWLSSKRFIIFPPIFIIGYPELKGRIQQTTKRKKTSKSNVSVCIKFPCDLDIYFFLAIHIKRIVLGLFALLRFNLAHVEFQFFSFKNVSIGATALTWSWRDSGWNGNGKNR